MLQVVLEVLRNPFGLSAICCVCLGLVGLALMIADIAGGRLPPVYPTALLGAGIIYAAMNIGLFARTISAGPFAIFDLAYLFSVGLVGPALAIGSLFVLVRGRERLGWLSRIGFSCWVACVGFAHLWVVAAASASV